MSLILNVPYAEKDEAKSLGARWNPELKKWYVTDKKYYYKFYKWLKNFDTNLIILDHIYIIIGEHQCFKCKKTTPVVSLASDSYIMIDDGYFQLFEGDVNFIDDVGNIPETLQKYMNENYKYYKGFSKTTESYYFGNHCDNCGILQGNFFLHSEIDSPFFIDSVEKAVNLKVLRIKLQSDLEINGSVGWGSSDCWIKMFAKFSDIPLTL